MNKEQLKEYLCQVIDSLTEYDLEHFLIDNSEPDLMSFAEEIVSLKGELKKMNTVSLKLNSNIRTIIEKQNIDIVSDEATQIDENIKNLLENLIDFDVFFKRTYQHFEELPELSLLNLINFRKHFLIWKGGFRILNEKWEHLLNISEIQRTGIIGETFNPLYHEATGTSDKTSVQNNLITDYQEMGYLYKKSLLKRAKVTVNKKS